jgi:arylsulfatase
MLFASSIAAQDVLPFPAPPMGGKVGPTMQESVHKWREQARHLPEDAPYILIVMLDDAGYGQAGTFGGEIGLLFSHSVGSHWEVSPARKP